MTISAIATSLLPPGAWSLEPQARLTPSSPVAPTPISAAQLPVLVVPLDSSVVKHGPRVKEQADFGATKTWARVPLIKGLRPGPRHQSPWIKLSSSVDGDLCFPHWWLYELATFSNTLAAPPAGRRHR